MAIRYPLFGGAPERVPDTDPTEGREPGQGVEVAFPGAAELAARVAEDTDPDRRRRGAAGAADALYQESQARGWGMDREACRDRVNRARRTTANRK